MRKRVLAGAGLALVLAAQGASATTYCYTGVAGFSACASAAIVVSGGQTVLQIAIQNLSGIQGNTYFSINQFGLYYIVPPNYTGSLTGLVPPFPGWKNGVTAGLTSPGPTAGVAKWVGGARAVNARTSSLVGCTVPAGVTGINTCGGPATFSFSLAAGSSFSLANLNVGLRGARWTAQGSNQLISESFQCLSSDPTCVSTVPEPMTMTLLATGLVGVGLVQIKRRRRRQQ